MAHGAHPLPMLNKSKMRVVTRELEIDGENLVGGRYDEGESDGMGGVKGMIVYLKLLV